MSSTTDPWFPVPVRLIKSGWLARLSRIELAVLLVFLRVPEQVEGRCRVAGRGDGSEGDWA